MALIKLISGGQTGVDRGALDAALAVGFPCGGWCPPGRLAEDGLIPDRYPLTEMAEGGYRRRTRQNALDSDATAVLHFGELEGGTAYTVAQCRHHQKPCVIIDANATASDAAAVMMRNHLIEYGASVLNVAGPRLSKVPQAHAYAFAAIQSLIRMVV